MHRIVRPELLDALPAAAPEAVASRRDLRRINRLMGHARVLRGAFRDCLPADAGSPWQVAELGAGDGEFTARLWRGLPPPPAGSRLWLIDRQTTPTPVAVAALLARGWEVRPVVGEAVHWLAAPGVGMMDEAPPRLDLIYGNLFAHHFDGTALRALLAAVASRTRAFAAAEPRRSRRALLGAWLLRFVGCHPVTHHDALVSVRAGFRGCELSGAWPASAGWALREGAAGLFSHRFSAWRSPQAS